MASVDVTSTSRVSTHAAISPKDCHIPFCRYHAHLQSQPAPIIPPYSDAYASRMDERNAENGDDPAFDKIPHVTAQLAQMTATAKPPKRKTQATEVFFPLSYIQTEWQTKLEAAGVSKRKLRYYLGDEIFCHGCTTASPASSFASPFVFEEAFFAGQLPTQAVLYLSEYQVDWLVDQFYESIAGKAGNTTYSNIDVDRSKAVMRNEFGGVRKLAFGGPGGMQAFRERSSKAIGPENVPAVLREGVPVTSNSLIADNTGPAISRFGSKNGNNKRAMHPIALPPVPLLVMPAITVASGLTKASRQALVQQQRQAALAAHVQHQKLCLPVYRRLYQHLTMFGGCAMACDVESWTEDADVLLELGLAWKKWIVKGGKGSIESGSEHYIIEETIQYRNAEIETTRYDYAGGKSRIAPKEAVSEALKSAIAQLSGDGPLVLVFHDASAETRYFQRLGIDPTSFDVGISRIFSDGRGDTCGAVMIQDTQNLFCGWSDPPIKQINLAKACAELQIPAVKLHNAGNDANATLELWETILRMKSDTVQKPADLI